MTSFVAIGSGQPRRYVFGFNWKDPPAPPDDARLDMLFLAMAI